MVLVKNTNSTGLDSIDKEPGVEVPRETLNKIQEWVRTREYDDDDMLDMYRTKEFGEYLVDREHFHGPKNEDHVTIHHGDNLACKTLSNFLEI